MLLNTPWFLILHNIYFIVKNDKQLPLVGLNWKHAIAATLVCVPAELKIPGIVNVISNSQISAAISNKVCFVTYILA